LRSVFLSRHLIRVRSSREGLLGTGPDSSPIMLKS
jgi:hypothetical protein